MSKHTPGPWRAWHDSYGRFQIIAGGLPLDPERDGAQPGEGAANAALIAAAPDLLAALEQIVNLDLGCASLEDKREADAIFASAREAIAKANGGAK